MPVESILIDGQPGKKYYFEYTQNDFRVRRKRRLGRANGQTFPALKSTKSAKTSCDSGSSMVNPSPLGQPPPSRALPWHQPNPGKSLTTKSPPPRNGNSSLLKPGLPFQVTPIVCHLAIWEDWQVLSHRLSASPAFSLSTPSRVPQSAVHQCRA